MPAKTLRMLIWDEALVMINVGREDVMGVENNSEYAGSLLQM